MPCNAKATVRASVSAEHLRSLLTAEVTSKITRSIVAQYLHATNPNVEIETRSTEDGYCVRLAGYYGVDVFVSAFGQVKVNTTTDGQKSWAARLSEEVTQLLTSIGGQLFQERMKGIVKGMYGDTQAKTDAAGTLVLTFTADVITRLVITQGGAVGFFTDTGSFEDGKKQIARLVGIMQAKTIPISLEGEVEQHRHEDMPAQQQSQIRDGQSHRH